MLREKILTLMSLTTTPLDRVATAYADEWRTAFEAGYGELPEEVKQALASIESALREQLETVRDKLVAVYTKYFNEEQLDAHIAFRQSAAHKHFESVSLDLNRDLAEVLDDWKSGAAKSREADLHRFLGGAQAAPAVEPPPAA